MDSLEGQGHWDDQGGYNLAHISRKLSSSLEGALAGGGDPATSPLYVFGPFLKLIVVAGVAQITFGASVWLVVFTIAMVSAMYRLVMTWVTDGSGGSGLSEEEFGGWAVKINASITFIEYTLTFLVSMAALVTFIADRFPILNSAVLGIQYRTFVAIILSLLTGWLVNRGPKAATRTFGPATAGVLLLLWAMVIATVWKLGLHLPAFDLHAFSPGYLDFTFGGYARILAVMTGVEVFANLVAAYDGSPQEKSKKAFRSLLIIMGTTSVTMLIVGPAIFQLSIPTNEHVSVFTQTMDQLLPAPIAYLGTLIGVAVLLSASAASAQGLQNLALGLRDRHYIPAFIGQRNRFDVADKPVWIEVGLVSLCFLAFGTSEETYLALYAAGVFILLSMTGWAASKRLVRALAAEFSAMHVTTLIGAAIAATLTSGATIIIFRERFLEGAWTYFVFIPVLYVVFTYFRQKLGVPSLLKEQLGEIEVAMLGGFGLGQSASPTPSPALLTLESAQDVWQPAPSFAERWRREPVAFQRLLVPLDGSASAEHALPMAETICLGYQASLTLVSVLQAQDRLRFFPTTQSRQRRMAEASRVEREAYLSHIVRQAYANGNGMDVGYTVSVGPIADEINALAYEVGVDLVVMSTHGCSGADHRLIGREANKIVRLVNKPVLLVRPASNGNGKSPHLKKLLLALDGSEYAERMLPYANALATRFNSEILLLSVPEVPETWKYGAMAGAVEGLRAEAEGEICLYLERIAAAFREQGLNVQAMVTGSGPARTIVAVSESEAVDLIMLATHGRGGLDRLFMGSVADRVVQQTRRPVFLVPVQERRIKQKVRGSLNADRGQRKRASL
jgi:nucleotide-binding universal stress UspA family protein